MAMNVSPDAVIKGIFKGESFYWRFDVKDLEGNEIPCAGAAVYARAHNDSVTLFEKHDGDFDKTYEDDGGFRVLVDLNEAGTFDVHFRVTFASGITRIKKYQAVVEDPEIPGGS